MIGADTNVLARLFVVDDPKQSEIAVRFFADRSPDDPAFVSLVVLAELVWLLDDTYDFPHKVVVDVLAKLLASPDFVVEEAGLVARVVALAEQMTVDIADGLIAQVALANGSTATVTFDRNAAKRVPGMELLK